MKSVKTKMKNMAPLLKDSRVMKKVSLGFGLTRRINRKPVSRKEQLAFTLKNFPKLHVQNTCKSKAKQVSKFLDKLDIVPVKSELFLYSVDYYKKLQNQFTVFGNTTVDYSRLINGNFLEIRKKLESEKNEFFEGMLMILDAMQRWVDRCKKDKIVSKKYSRSISAIESVFERDACSFYEALQRILFFNQFLWQTGHTLNGLGCLDKILIDLYRKDIKEGSLTEEIALDMIKDFMNTLHEIYWYKSNVLLGDTGQIIILGGLQSDGTYLYNELTHLFIVAARELKLPDPKVLLRCSGAMPKEVMQEALSCIATGIGAPLLSNDDVIIPALISFGYEESDAFDYVTAACWEPAAVKSSLDSANIASLNFSYPFVKMFNEEDIENISSADELTKKYFVYLDSYLKEMADKVSGFRYEEDPLVSLLSDSCITSGKDITRGGSRYANIGFTSVGLGTVVNSILNLQRLVFSSEKYTLSQLNTWRKENFDGHDEVINEFKELRYGFGTDSDEAVALTKAIVSETDKVLSCCSTLSGGKFRFGLSSPGYISDAVKTGATFDGRKSGEPFSVHISAQNAGTPTELLSFASKIGYSGSCINGNVADFFVSPNSLRSDAEKYRLLLQSALKQGIYQAQINVVESKTLIEAKKNPKLFPNLVVRVWGFSAYFNDLPEEYKDLLIRRAIESEKSA